jgi:hypothetical protein
MVQTQAPVQSRVDQLSPRRPWARVVVVLGVIAVLAVVLAAVAAAAGRPGKPRPFDQAATYDLTLPVGAGPQEVELLVIGDVTITAQCEAWSSATPGYPYGVGIVGGWGVTNNGDDPVAFVSEPGTRFSDAGQATVWLAPGESSGGGGEWVNEEFPEGNASWESFAFLDYGGTSATGILAWSARVNPGALDVVGDEFGECVLTIQAEG